MLASAEGAAEGDPSRRRRLDPKAASMAGFASPHGAAAGAGAGARASSSGSSSGWKERLKARCLNRVRQERDRLVQGMRGLASPPPPGAAVGAEQQLQQQQRPPSAQARPLHSPLPGDGAAGRGRPTTPAALLADTALSILQDEMRATAREGGGRSDAVVTMEEAGEGEVSGGSGSGGEREREERGSPSLEAELARLSPEEHWELMRCIEEALAEEVRLAEERAGEEFAWLEDAEVDATVDALFDGDGPLSDDVAVLCPACKGNYLLQEPGGDGMQGSCGGGGGPIFCTCGLRLEGSSTSSSSLTLAELQHRLAAAYARHRSSCGSGRDPAFFQRDGHDLWMECTACGLTAPIVS